MNFEIIELEEFSGRAAAIYSVLMEGEEGTLFDNFVEENLGEFEEEVQSIMSRINSISDKVGAREIYFKVDEGKPGDGVCALYDDPNSKLRLYCIRYGSAAVILGGGGPKPPDIRAWQENEKLSEEANKMIRISKAIMARLRSGDISWEKGGTKLSGELNFSDNE